MPSDYLSRLVREALPPGTPAPTKLRELVGLAIERPTDELLKAAAMAVVHVGLQYDPDCGLAEELRDLATILWTERAWQHAKRSGAAE